MASEPKRGCGYRKIGGLYLAGPLTGDFCHRLPIPCDICPTCKHGIKQTRGWTWVDPWTLLEDNCNSDEDGLSDINHCNACPACRRQLFDGNQAGILWIGEKFYPTVKHWYKEAVELGVSRRIPAVPKGFRLGEHYVFMGHPKAIEGGEPPDYGESKAGIFRVWKPQKVEMIVTGKMLQNQKFKEDLERKGITPVIVPEDDPDHQPRKKKGGADE